MIQTKPINCGHCGAILARIPVQKPTKNIISLQMKCNKCNHSSLVTCDRLLWEQVLEEERQMNENEIDL